MMLSTRSDRRWFVPVFAGFIALHLVLIWTTRLFPFTDLPNHLAAATINRYHSDPACSFADYFKIELFSRPNVFHLLFCSQKIFPSVELANRVFLSLYALLLPLSALFFLRRTGGSRWHSIAAFILLYNYSVSWGFVGFFFSIPLLLIFAGLLTGYFERGGGGSAVPITLLLTALFFVHALAALFALLLLVVCGLLRSRDGPLALLSRLAPALPLVFLLIAWWRSQPDGESLGGFLAGYYADGFFQSILPRAHILFLDNYHLYKEWSGILAGSVLTCAIAAPGILSLIRAHGKSDRGKLVRSVPFILFACSLACFFFLPHEIPRQSILYQRFSVLLLLSLVFLGAYVERAGILSLPKILYIAAAVTHLVLWAGYFTGFDAENEGFDASFFPEASAGERLAGLVFDFTYRGKPVYIHFPSYFTVWGRGIAATSFVDYRFGFVRGRPGGARLPRYQEWIGKTDGSQGRYGAMDYILVRGSLPESAKHHISGRSLLEQASKWRLYGRETTD
ncbi:MAG: hypothetical protein KAX13_10230 [Candidatus Krumholzibacteria bacterium]|nr:hypothetical protein [Candidatus Krumholzibacteria bacterium]